MALSESPATERLPAPQRSTPPNPLLIRCRRRRKQPSLPSLTLLRWRVRLLDKGEGLAQVRVDDATEAAPRSKLFECRQKDREL